MLEAAKEKRADPKAFSGGRNGIAVKPSGKAYMHNGVFKSLKEVVNFYNTRDIEDC